MHRKKRFQSSRKGAMLVMCYMLVAVVTAWVSTTFQMGLVSVRAAEDKVDKTQAFHIAEAGLNRAIVNMRGGDTNSIASTAYADATYVVTVTEPSSGLFMVTSQGNAGLRQQSSVEAYIQLLSNTIFDYSIFAKSGITLFGSTFTDSYNECVAPYDVATAGDNGDIGTNSTDGGAVTMKNNSAVNGGVSVGPGLATPTDATSIHGGATVTDTPAVSSLSEVVEMPSIAAPDGATCTDVDLSNSDSLVLYDTFSPYCFNTMRLKNSASISVVGDVVVYTGDLTTDNSAVVNMGGTPDQLTILVTSDADVSIKNSGGFKGGIYAPDSAVGLDNGAHIYGAVMGDTVDLKNSSALHYDECLADVFSLPGDAEPSVLSWREL